MRSGSVPLANRWGMHARLAFHLAAEAGRFACAVRIGCRARWADGKEIMDLLMLEVLPGEELTVETAGDGEDAAYEALTCFLLNDAKLL